MFNIWRRNKSEKLRNLSIYINIFSLERWSLNKFDKCSWFFNFISTLNNNNKLSTLYCSARISLSEYWSFEGVGFTQFLWIYMDKPKREFQRCLVWVIYRFVINTNINFGSHLMSKANSVFIAYQGNNLESSREGLHRFPR